MLSDRLPPQHLEAERGVLGSILLDNKIMRDLVVFLRAEDFYRDTHQVIYAVIRELYDKGNGIDAVTLAKELKLQGVFDKVGGDDMLSEIVTSVPHAANGKYYAEIIKEKATSRQLIEAATEIIRDGFSNQFTAEELLEGAERKLLGIAVDVWTKEQFESTVQWLLSQGQRVDERSDAYRRYLASEEWAVRRRKALDAAGHRCRVCYAGDKVLDVHHRTYERLYNERPDDLTVLCRECHGLFSRHGKLARPYGYVPPPPSAD